MMAYDNTNTGVLFKSKSKDAEHPTWPDYKGSINIEGEDFWLSAWVKRTKDGQAFMSLSIGEPKTKAPAKRTPAPSDGGMDIDNDLPF